MEQASIVVRDSPFKLSRAMMVQIWPVGTVYRIDVHEEDLYREGRNRKPFWATKEWLEVVVEILEDEWSRAPKWMTRTDV